MLVHGWPQSSYCWHEVAHYLQDYYIIAPDLRGLGDSERTLEVEAYAKDELGKDLFFPSRCIGDRPLLFGWSRLGIGCGTRNGPCPARAHSQIDLDQYDAHSSRQREKRRPGKN